LFIVVESLTEKYNDINPNGGKQHKNPISETHRYESQKLFEPGMTFGLTH